MPDLSDEEREDLYDDERDLEEQPECPECGGVGVGMGKLGKLMWFRCRDCGSVFYATEEDTDDH